MNNLQDRSTACNMMKFYMKELNIDINKLNIVHVAGSKGKGSTCAFVDSALRKYGYKTGNPYSSLMIERIVYISSYPIFMRTFLHQRKANFQGNLSQALFRRLVQIAGD